MAISQKLLALCCVFILLPSCQSSKKEASHDSTELQVGTKTSNLVKLKTLFPQRDINIRNPFDDGRLNFVAFNLITVLDAYLGPSWKSADGILFTATDGFKVDVTVAKILEYKPLLAFQFQNTLQAFRLPKRNPSEGVAELGPYFLIWDNLTHKELYNSGESDWPYQIHKIESIIYSSHYAKVFPFKIYNSQLKEGFDFYKKHCMTCHALKDEGGLKGAQLWPYPIEAMGIKKFSQWVLNPQSLKEGTPMPPIYTKLPESQRKEIAQKVYRYLVALNKRNTQ